MSARLRDRDASDAGKVGQNVLQSKDWPLGEPLANYTRTINYDAGTSVETFERVPGLNSTPIASLTASNTGSGST